MAPWATLEPAVNAIKAATEPQTFLGVGLDGRASVVATTGNPDCHIILRGGESGPNHDAASVAATRALLEKHGLTRGDHDRCEPRQLREGPPADAGGV